MGHNGNAYKILNFKRAAWKSRFWMGR